MEAISPRQHIKNISPLSSLVCFLLLQTLWKLMSFLLCMIIIQRVCTWAVCILFLSNGLISAARRRERPNETRSRRSLLSFFSIYWSSCTVLSQTVYTLIGGILSYCSLIRTLSLSAAVNNWNYIFSDALSLWNLFQQCKFITVSHTLSPKVISLQLCSLY